MKKNNTLFACFLLLFSNIHAQVNIEWQKSLGNSQTYFSSTKQSGDGGYIMVGSVGKPYPGGDAIAIKLNSSGNIQWQKVIGDPTTFSGFTSVASTADGGYIVCGVKACILYENCPGNFLKRHWWILKLTSAGTISWEKTLGGSTSERPYDIYQASDGGYIIAGATGSNDGDVSENKGYDDAWIVKLGSSGNILWEKTLGGSDYDNAEAIRPTSDGGYIVAAGTGSNDGDVSGKHAGGRDWWIVKLSSSRSIQWQKCLGGTAIYPDNCYSIEQTTDGGYIVVGGAYSFDGDITQHYGGEDWWIVKLSSTGTLEWQKSFGGYDDESASSVKQTSDGGYIIVGDTGPDHNIFSGGNNGGGDLWMVKLESNGDLSWEKNFGGSDEDWGDDIELTSDGYIVGGMSYSNDGDVSNKQDSMNIWILKLTKGPILLVAATTTVTKSITGSNATNIDSMNYRLATLKPIDPNALFGNVTTTVTVNSTISTFNNLPFVRRHYDITPAVNAANAHATVTLYFTQHDFDLFNAYVTNSNLNIPLLPTGGVDNGNLRITQFHGNFTGTSDPANYNNGTSLITPPTLVVAWDNANEYWSVTFPVTHFSGFYLSTVDLTTLPLTLLKFTGMVQKDAVNLLWLTTDEVNTKEFVIERSSNSIGYAAIGKVSAQSTADIHEYNFTDPQPSTGNNFYRLKMMDIDGHFTYSNILLIKINEAVSKISAYPNPLVSNSINLQFINQPKGVYNLRLINRLGQVMLTKQILHSEGNQTEILKLHNSIQKGHYILEVIAPDNSKQLLEIVY